MKKTAIAIIAATLLIGCTGENTGAGDNGSIRKISSKVRVTDEEYTQMVTILKNKTADKASRLQALKVLEEKKYKGLKSVVEDTLKNETQIRNELFLFSLKYKNFNYDANDKDELLRILLNEKKYIDFLEIYEAGDVELITSDMVSLMKEDLAKKEAEKTQLNKLIRKLSTDVSRMEKHQNELKNISFVDENIIRSDVEKDRSKETEKIKYEISEYQNQLKVNLENQDTKKRYIDDLGKMINEAQRNKQDELQKVLDENKLQAEKQLAELKDENKLINNKMKKSEEILEKVNVKYNLIIENNIAVAKKANEPKIKENNMKIVEIDEKISESKEKIEKIKQEIQNIQIDMNEINTKIEKSDNALVLTNDDFDAMISVKMKDKSMKKLCLIAEETQNFYLFKKISDIDLIGAIVNVSDQNFHWIEKILIENETKYLYIIDFINSENYSKYKNVIYDYYNKNKLMKETVELIIQNEGNIDKRVLDTNYHMQSTAIRIYGLKRSMDLLKKELEQNPRFEVYRGLAIIRDRDIFNLVFQKYNETKNIDFLEIMYLIRTEQSREYMKEVVIELSEEEQREIIEKLFYYNKQDGVRFAYELLEKSTTIENNKMRLVYVDYIGENDTNLLIKSVLMLVENNLVSDDEKSHLVTILKEHGGEETSGQILKTLETDEYKKYQDNERTRVAFSSKIELWNEYLTKFPNTYYRDKIEQKLNLYNNKVEEIKKSIKYSFDQQMIQIDEKITAYQDIMSDETDINNIYSIEDKIEELRNRKKELQAEANMSTKEKLSNLQVEYFKLNDEVNSLYQHISFLIQNEGNEREVQRIRENMKLVELKQATVLEKIILLYGVYIDENKDSAVNLEFLSKDLMREIRGKNN